MASPLQIAVRVLTALAILSSSGCASDAKREPEATEPPATGAEIDAGAKLPLDAAQVVDKLAACSHFAGEFGGDNSQRDREVTAAIVQLRCETIDEDVRGIVVKYAGNKQVLEALKLATQR